jgi:GT2 family glycosyltransferase
VGWVRSADRNPARRRNLAAEFASGELLGFLDDDGEAAPDWLATAAEVGRRAKLFGGLDLAPRKSSLAERVSDLLLATPLIGSGVAAHEKRPRRGRIRRPSDLTLCNLFVSRDLFDSLGGFDESLGYGAEDTDLVARAMRVGEEAVLEPSLVVFHERRRFPGEYLRQRWRYRWKTGRLLVLRPSLVPSRLIAAFLAVGLLTAVGGALLGKRFLGPASLAYALVVSTLSFPIWRRDLALLPIAPVAFALHHACYWTATAAGAVSTAAGCLRRTPS